MTWAHKGFFEEKLLTARVKNGAPDQRTKGNMALLTLKTAVTTALKVGDTVAQKSDMLTFTGTVMKSVAGRGAPAVEETEAMPMPELFQLPTKQCHALLH